jgi:hypothetical protein
MMLYIDSLAVTAGKDPLKFNGKLGSYLETPERQKVEYDYQPLT